MVGATKAVPHMANWYRTRGISDLADRILSALNQLIEQIMRGINNQGDGFNVATRVIQTKSFTNIAVAYILARHLSSR